MNWTQTFIGNRWDYTEAGAKTVDWYEVATVLSRIPRFNGHTRYSYSVAQHCCLAHDRIDGRPKVKLAALLHDAHEFVTGDITTPVAHSIADAIAEELGPDGGEAARRAIARIKDRQDRAIYAAAGLTWPLCPSTVAAIKDVDQRLLMTERRDMMVKPPEPWGELENVKPFKARIVALPARSAAIEWLERLNAGLRLTGVLE